MRKLFLTVAAIATGALVAGLALAARNGSGTYALPYSPVVGGNTISSTWANGTLNDVSSELTNSLDRNGRGAMLQPLKLADGAVGAPGLTFNGEQTTGLYRIGANDLGLTVNGVLKHELAAALSTTYGDAAVTGGLTVTGATVASGTLNVTGTTTLGTANVTTDNITTANIGTAVITTATAGLTNTSTMAGKWTRANLPTVGQQTSTTCGAAWTNATGTYADVTNLTVTITTTGRPVLLLLQPDGDATSAVGGGIPSPTNRNAMFSTGDGSPFGVQFVRDAGAAVWQFAEATKTLGGAGPMMALDTGAGAGAHTYKVQGKTSSNTLTCYYLVLVAFEL